MLFFPIEALLSPDFWLDPRPGQPSFYLGVLLGASLAGAGFCLLLRSYARRRLGGRPVVRRLALNVAFRGLLLGGSGSFFVLARLLDIPYLSIRIFPGLVLLVTAAELIHLAYYRSRHYARERDEYEQTLKERQRRHRERRATVSSTTPGERRTDSHRGAP